LESFVVWYTTEDSFIIGVACGKKWGRLRSLKALEFEKWGLEPSSLTEVYAYVPCNILLCTQLLYNLPLTVNDISLLVSSGNYCLNLFHPL